MDCNHWIVIFSTGKASQRHAQVPSHRQRWGKMSVTLTRRGVFRVVVRRTSTNGTFAIPFSPMAKPITPRLSLLPSRPLLGVF